MNMETEYIHPGRISSSYSKAGKYTVRGAKYIETEKPMVLFKTSVAGNLHGV